MANSTTAKDLINGALRRAGEPPSSNSQLLDDAVKYMNLAYRAVLSGSTEYNIDFGDVFPWARERYSKCIILKAPFEEGTVSVTNGSAAGEFSSAPTESMVGRHFFVETEGVEGDYFLIKKHKANETNFTLECEYSGETNTAANFKAYKLIYELGSGILRLAEAFNVYRTQSSNDDMFKIWYLDENTFNKDYPVRRVRRDIPDHFTIVHESENNWFVQFNTYVEEDIKIDIDWVKNPEELTYSDGSIPIIPIKHRVVLEYLTASMLLNDKNDSRQASIMFNVGKNMLSAMVEDFNKQRQRTTNNRARLIPRRDNMGRRGRYRYWS